MEPSKSAVMFSQKYEKPAEPQDQQQIKVLPPSTYQNAEHCHTKDLITLEQQEYGTN